jgi:hypothetical protein
MFISRSNIVADYSVFGPACALLRRNMSYYLDTDWSERDSVEISHAEQVLSR